ncbi:hypothetical protein LOTGIDRAFT_180300 [Lottia gigantea]|uniref:JmjC domain-containing protein n=1 Tax=Lottia gigantea TaxID=225164 RepID=V4B211_LOTGI|nr:hypothetical protein LOTGIDRAFT_180300 [Lottia gigantea]ESP01531.1 hypothetical protein LOTGIDRAFT_180300 [Lottia gigantea]
MDNILIQVTGTKRVVLFSPSDVQYLYLNGDKSEVLDIDNPDVEKYPEFLKATRYECNLEPGDILFIPALWFHNVISLDFGVAVNVFWKHLGIYYQLNVPLDRALKTLDELPVEYKEFYARRLIARIESKVILRNPDTT